MKKINISGINETLYHETLENGLNIYLIPNKNVKNYYITFTTKFGSVDLEFKRDNSDYMKVPSGVAHFLEHLTFKMEGDTDASDYLASLGCQCNAFTSYNETCYEVYGYKNFKEALTYLIDYVQTPFYTKENVEAEKGIICEEIKMRSDNPAVKLMEGINNSLFVKSNRRIPIAGSQKDVKSTTLEDILNCYNTFYHPSNMFIIITGNFNPEEASAIIYENQSNKDFGKPIVIKRKQITEPDKINNEFNEIKANIEIEKASISLKIALSEFEGLDLTKEEISVYASIITASNFGRSSELRERLTSGNIITDGPYVGKYIADDHLIISIQAETEYPNRFINEVKEVINNMEITDKDLTRKKRVAISNFIVGFDSIEDINNNFMNDIIMYDRVIDNIYDIYTKLNINDATKVLEKLKPSNICINTLKKNTD